MTKAVVIVEVLVTEAQAEDALLEQGDQRMFDKVGIAMVGEAGDERVEQAEPGIDFAEQEGSGVGGDTTAVEVGEDITGAEVLESEGGGDTLCHDSMAPSVGDKWLVAQTLTHGRAVGFLHLVRNAG